MAKILRKSELVAGIHEILVEAPQLAAKARPGNFVIVMAEERGERIPLTIADCDAAEGTITLVLMAVGTTSRKLASLSAGDELHALIGPLGRPSEIGSFGTVVAVAGGVGVAPVYPIAKAFRNRGTRVITIQGARSADLLFWQDRLASVSDWHIVTTDDGSAGTRGLVTEPLKRLLEGPEGKQIGCVYAIGPAMMMKFCAETTRPFGTKTVVSLNTVMVDGTGMCGGCRVTVGNETLFTCVDGPEFDGHLVHWDTVVSRQRIYSLEEKRSLDRYMKGVKCG